MPSTMVPSPDAPPKPPGTFADCALAFVPSATLPSSTIQSISETLIENGADIVEPARDGTIRLNKVTHIVSNSVDFPEYADAQAAMIPVVTSAWAFHSAAKGKQMPLRGFSPDPRLIFSKVMLTCADLPTVDKETISGAITALGGLETPDLSKQTTHVCALSMDHPKCQRARAQLPKVKIVLPHWFDDCFKLGKRIDEGPYLLPDPEILRKDPSEHVPVPSITDELKGASTPTPGHAPTPNTGAAEQSLRVPLTVFAHKTVMLATDLALTTRLRDIIVGLIVDGGGRMVHDVDDCDMLVCHFREGEDYVGASKESKDVGNLAWLYYLVTHNEWISPFRRLLHYPVPRNGIPGFEKFTISISNYGGDARTYLENIIRALGATYTRTMTADNSHLITARNSGDKCSAAADWNVTMVNHLWLEECYAQCELIATKPKHMHFPSRTNLGEIVGQTSFDQEWLAELYFPGKQMAVRSAKKKPAERKPAEKTVEKTVDKKAVGRKPAGKKSAGKKATGKKSLDDEPEVSEEPVEEAEAAQDDNSNDDLDDDDDKENDDEKDDKDDENGEGSDGKGKKKVDTEDGGEEKSKKPTRPRKAQKSAPTAAATAAAVATPARPRRGPEGKEHEDDDAVIATGGRSAKAKAIASLHDIAPDVALYEKEKKRGIKDGLWGGKRAADQMDAARSSSPAEETDERPAKKMRPALPPVEKRVVLTGFERWAQQPGAEEKDRKKLRDMGILIVQPTQPCDYLVAPHMVRTVKFLVALARGPTVLSCDFIEKALEMGQHPPPEDFILQDVEGEERYGFKLETSIARARANRGRLLRNVPVFCTANIRNGHESYKAVAEAHGALFKLYKGRSAPIRPTTAEQDGGHPPEPVYLLSSNTPEEHSLWPRFEEMAEAGHMEPRIVAPDWLLEVVLRQQVWFEDRYLARKFFRGTSEVSEVSEAQYKGSSKPDEDKDGSHQDESKDSKQGKSKDGKLDKSKDGKLDKSKDSKQEKKQGKSKIQKTAAPKRAGRG